MSILNFSAGPAVLPKEVLQRAAEEMLDWHGSGMSVMEMSHRGHKFNEIGEGGRLWSTTCASSSATTDNR